MKLTEEFSFFVVIILFLALVVVDAQNITTPPPFSTTGFANATTCTNNNGGCDYRTICTPTAIGRTCGPCPQGTSGTGETGCALLCGNNICDSPIENCLSCPRDCGTSCRMCGDLVCDYPEEICSCESDCGPCNAKCDCGPHGRCNIGECECDTDWSGSTCAIYGKGEIEAAPDSLQPNVKVNEFYLSLHTIAEVDENNEVIYEYSLFSLYYSYSTTNQNKNSIFTYRSLDLMNQATITITIHQFKEPSTSVLFANTTQTFTQNSLNLNVRIENWPFQNKNNVLHMRFQNMAEHLVCAGSKPEATESGNLKWLATYSSGSYLYGQFLDLSNIDGTIRKITYLSNDSTYIIAVVPHFWYFAETSNMAYSVHASKVGKEVKCEGEGSNNTVIIIVVIFSGLSILIIASVLVFIRVKYMSVRRVRLKKRYSDSIDFEEM